MASTYPNRHYQLVGAERGAEVERAAVVGPNGSATSGRRSSTARRRAGSRSRYYVSDLPVPALYGARGLQLGAPGRRSSTPTRRPARCRTICFVDPPFRDGGGGDGISADEHPHGDVRLGQAFMSDVVHAFIESPQYRARRDVHQLRRVGRLLRPRARRRHVPDDRANRQDLDEDFGR